MKTKLILLLFIIPILLTGCYNYRELDKLGITSAIGISKDSDQYKLTIQVFSTEKSSDEKSEAPKFVTFNSYGKTIQEALRNVINESSKRLYINHMQVLLIDQEIAKDDLKDIIDFFFRDTESRKQFLVLIAKSNVEDILKSKTLLDKVNGKSINSTTKTNNEFLGSSKKITYAEFITDYINSYKEITLPCVESNDDKVTLSDTAIFKDNKLIGFINEEDSIIVNLINNKIDNTILTYENDNKYTTIEITSSKSNIKIKDKDINIKINMKSNIADINYDININDYNNIEKIEKIFEEKLNSDIKNTVDKIIKNYKTDIFGFIDIIYKESPEIIKNNTVEINDFNINIETTIKIDSKGNGADIIEVNKN